MSYSKQVSEFTAKRVIMETSLPVDVVLTRLDGYLNRANSSDLFPILRGSKDKAELEANVQGLLGDNDFLFFNALKHSAWLQTYDTSADADFPSTIQYVFGNPLLAQKILQYDLLAGLHVPLRILISEHKSATDSGTRIAYLVPSSVMSIDVDTEDGRKLRAAAEVVDEKLDALLKKVVRAEEIP